MTSNLLSLAFCCGRGNVIHSPNLILFIFFLGHTEDIFPSFPCSEVWPYSHTLANEESWLCPFWAQVAKSQCTFLQAPPLRLLQGSYRPCMPAGIARVGHLLTESCWRETHNLHFRLSCVKRLRFLWLVVTAAGLDYRDWLSINIPYVNSPMRLSVIYCLSLPSLWRTLYSKMKLNITLLKDYCWGCSSVSHIVSPDKNQ